jgi:hypothetical protein
LIAITSGPGGLAIRLRIGLVRFMVTDDATSGSAQLAVSRHVASDAADNGSLDAALGVRAGRVSERNHKRLPELLS